MKIPSWLAAIGLALLLAAPWAADRGAAAGLPPARALQRALAPLRREPTADAAVRHFRYEALFEEAETAGDPRSLVEIVPDDVLFWRLNRGKRIIVLGKPFDVNSDGMRDKERPTARRAGYERVAVLGASIAVGYGVDEKESFARRLETLLNGSGRQVEVLNFGVPGYSPVLFLEQYPRQVAKYMPDRILVCLGRGALHADLQRLERASRWSNLVKRKLAYDNDYAGPLYLGRVRELAREAGVSGLPSLWRPASADPADRPARDVALLRHVFTLLNAEASARDAVVTVVYLPVLNEPEHAARAEQAREAAAGAGLGFWDLSGAFGDGQANYRLMPGDGHYNAAGHDLVARELYRRMTSTRR